MSAKTTQSKLSFQITEEQSLQLRALGKWRRRKVPGKLREALSGILIDLEISHEKS